MYHSLIDVPYGACVAEQDGGKEEIKFFSKQNVLLGTVIATLAAFGINLISKIMCGFYAMLIIDVV